MAMHRRMLVAEVILFIISAFFNVGVLLLHGVVTDSDQLKEQVNIGLVYKNYARSKVYDKAFKETIRNINAGQSISQIRKIAQRYALNPIECVLPRGMFYPSDVLNCLCNTLIRNKVALIVYVTAQETYDQVTSASQYFLHMASQTGIPIIAWNADNAGYNLVDLTHHRILQMAPPIEHQIRAMIAILRRYNWSNFGIVRSKIAGSVDFSQLVQQEVDNNNNDRSFNASNNQDQMRLL